MKKYIFTILFSIVFSGWLNGQMDCVVNEELPPQQKSNCQISSLTFDDVQVFPKMLTKVVFHFKTNPRGFNFVNDPPSPSRPWSVKNGFDFANGILGVLNSDHRFIDNYNINDPLDFDGTVTTELDFDFDFAYGIEQSVFFYENNESIVDDPNALNIRFQLENAALNSAGEAGRSNWMNLRNAQARVIEGLNPTNDPITKYGRLAMHEHGHTLDLDHTFTDFNNCNGIAFDCSQEACDQTCHNNNGNIGPGVFGCSHLMMAYSGAMNKITKCELEIMWNDYFNAGDSYRSVECKPEVSRLLRISENTAWDTKHIVDADIVISNNAALSINCEVLMGTDRKIIVESGSKLEVNGGMIRNLCSDTWKGIKVYGGNSDFDVKFTNEAIIENTSEAAVSMFAPEPWPQVQNFGNGILHAENTTFNNVKRIAEFIAWNPSNNSSYIRNCTQNGGKWSVTNWNCIGVEVSDNEFFDISHEAIVSSTGQFTIENNEIHSDVADVLLTNATPGFGCEIFDNEFHGTDTGLRGLGTAIDEHLVYENQFSSSFFGMFMDGDNFYKFEKNDVASRFGVASIDNGSHPNDVNTNTINGSDAGLLPLGDNPGYNFYLNCFTTNFGDVFIDEDIADVIAAGIGEAANNCFTHQGVETSQIGDMDGNPNPFTYIEPIDDVTDCLDAVKAHVNINVEELVDTESLYPCEFSGSGNGPFVTEIFNPCFDKKSGKNATEIKQSILWVEKKIQEIENRTDLTLGQKELYKSFYQRCLHKVKRYYYEYLFKEKQYETVRTELARENTDDARILIYSSYIHEGDQQGARAYLLSWSAPSSELVDFRSTQLINLNRLPYGKYYQPTATELSQVETLARKEHPYAAYAKALYYDLTGEIIESELPDFVRSIAPRSKSDEAVTEYSIYPNPTSDVLNISISNKENHEVYITDVTGREMLKEQIVGADRVNTTNWQSGIYFVTIKRNDEVLHQEKVVVVK